MTQKRRAKPARTKTVSSRLEIELLEVATAAAKEAGLSLGAFMREAVLEKLGRARVRGEAITDLHEDVRKLRADLALATEAILTVTGEGEDAHAEAEAWVLKNLNH